MRASDVDFAKHVLCCCYWYGLDPCLFYQYMFANVSSNVLSNQMMNAPTFKVVMHFCVSSAGHLGMGGREQSWIWSRSESLNLPALPALVVWRLGCAGTSLIGVCVVGGLPRVLVLFWLFGFGVCACRTLSLICIVHVSCWCLLQCAFIYISHPRWGWTGRWLPRWTGRWLPRLSHLGPSPHTGFHIESKMFPTCCPLLACWFVGCMFYVW